ncbi:carbohydrate ABC transporter permease [Dictyobacter kobayashii]|uniref:ABC transmembrane type-1 domain-containing protein n=1 Tax=Dictyobacter kobayashii TaxID=2014872 RepID=A0A402AY94_9CHLR|nr:carbohydrate ABC transporter permease [Dictyobacter kobayashii]GCE24082.1 hypothetical protein KDK_78820 [Dictyobacter kobayashii]
MLRRTIISTIIYIFLTLLGLFFLVPLLWPVLASINPAATLAVKWPDHPSLENYITILTNGVVIPPFTNSAIMAISTMILVVILSGLAAYPLSRFRFRFKNTLMLAVLFASALPILALVTPLYAMYVTLNLVDTLQGVILFFVASALPFSIWLMKNFLDSVPYELEEAAWIDGASTFTALMRVVLPLCARASRWSRSGVSWVPGPTSLCLDPAANTGIRACLGQHLHLLWQLWPG